jgi:hemoglobin
MAQQAMSAQGVPFATQNRLLALLAPMHRDVVTVH